MRCKFLWTIMLLELMASFSFAQLSLKYERFTLPNGLQVILHEDRSIPVISVNTWYHVGSAREKPGRTGFAHLFEHLMFEGSTNVPLGKFDEWLEAAGGDNNASTSEDRTNYYEDIPNNALELTLFLDSDRMAYLVDAMSPEKVNIQRDVVKNERRERIENQPYGLASLLIDSTLFPIGHPYHFPVIGSMEDLTAASYQDVVDFFKKYYAPANASLVIAGDIDPIKTKALVAKWFSDVPAGKPVPPADIPAVFVNEEKRIFLEDKVQLPRLYLNWITPPHFSPGDAELDVLSNILTGGKNSRLYKRLVYDLQIAQDVSSGQASKRLASTFSIVATARSGHTLGEIETIIREEMKKIRSEPPTVRELQRAVNGFEASFLDGLESVHNKAEFMNAYFTATGNPDYFNEDLARYKALSPDDVTAVAQTFLRDDGDVVLSVVPDGKKDLAAPGKGGGK